jgi:hypothetical protein
MPFLPQHEPVVRRKNAGDFHKDGRQIHAPSIIKEAAEFNKKLDTTGDHPRVKIG